MENVNNELKSLRQLLKNKDETALRGKINNFHPADIADIIEQSDNEMADSIVYFLTDENLAETLVEIDKTFFKQIVSKIEPKTIAKKLIPHLESDDAADLLEDVSEEKRISIISQLNENEFSNKVVKLLNYPDGTAGSLMATELISVNMNLNITQAFRKMRSQATKVENVYSVYVVDDNRKLIGLVSLKKILVKPKNTLISELVDTDIIYVKATDSFSNVVNKMSKYDLLTLPVVSEDNTLLGKITMDDVLDEIQEDSEKGMSLFSGIFGDININDSILKITQARIPWLIIGLFGGLLAASVIKGFETELEIFPEMIFFIPLIAAMAGNVGIQSSSIIVQAVANHNTILPKTINLIKKEFTIGMLNGAILSILVMLYSLLFSNGIEVGRVVSIALFCVIIFASIFGTIIPLMLHKLKINPALSTGPFITTTNDVIGLIIYFQMIGFFRNF